MTVSLHKASDLVRSRQQEGEGDFLISTVPPLTMTLVMVEHLWF